jgi:hypothetical protein
VLHSLVDGTDYLVIDPEDEYRRVVEDVDGQMVGLAQLRATRSTPSTW